MARKVKHNHPLIKDIRVKQFKKGNYRNPKKEGTIEDGKDLELDTSLKGYYYLSFQVPENSHSTVNFGRKYQVDKCTRKKDPDNPKMDLVIFRVANVSKPHTDLPAPEPADEDIEVKDPDSVPIE